MTTAILLLKICDELDVECDALESDAARLRSKIGVTIGNDFVVAKTLRTLARVVRRAVRT